MKSALKVPPADFFVDLCNGVDVIAKPNDRRIGVSSILNGDLNAGIAFLILLAFLELIASTT